LNARRAIWTVVLRLVRTRRDVASTAGRRFQRVQSSVPRVDENNELPIVRRNNALERR
jgi:hypothetical protein